MVFRVVVYAELGLLCVPSGSQCAERRLMKRLLLLASRKGIAPHNIVAWARRVYGEMEIRRPRADGTLGVSLPCVRCTHALNQMPLKWRATSDYNGGVCTDREARPPPKPTRGLTQCNGWLHQSREGGLTI
jgi:hypothetical protein